jgi:PTH1 family peptidyl-tRNA hydrolase
MAKLLVGLGNIGERYSLTRHNLGFILLDAIGKNFKSNAKFKAEVGEITLAGNTLPCIKPQTYMNLSGESVRAFCAFYQIAVEDCLIIHDDLDLPFGTIRLKSGGGEGGHNGLKSISNCLSSNQYARLRLGIDRPVPGSFLPIEEWVLQRFSQDQQKLLPEIIDRSTKALEMLIKDGFAKAQSLFNGSSV